MILAVSRQQNDAAPRSMLPVGPMQRRMSALGVIADITGFRRETVCPLLTHKRHWPCNAAMVLAPVSATIKVLV